MIKTRAQYLGYLGDLIYNMAMTREEDEFILRHLQIYLGVLAFSMELSPVPYAEDITTEDTRLSFKYRGLTDYARLIRNRKLS